MEIQKAAAAGTLAGVPTKAGAFSRATTYGDAVSFTVLDLPATAVGTFNGLVSLNGTNYPVLVTATKAGTLTAKIAAVSARRTVGPNDVGVASDISADSSPGVKSPSGPTKTAS